MKPPEKKFLSVDEIAESWKVDSSTILEMMVMGEILPSLFIDEVSCFVGKDMEGTNSRIMSGEIYFSPPHSVLTRDSFELHGGLFVCNYLAPSGSGEDAFGSTSDEVEAGDAIFFAEPQEFSVQDIRVRRYAFVEAAERRFSTEASATVSIVNEDSELKRTQRALAALVIGLAEKYTAYGSGEKPNVSQIARLATEHLRDADSDRTPHGFSETTVRQAIAAALKACPELSE